LGQEQVSIIDSEGEVIDEHHMGTQRAVDQRTENEKTQLVERHSEDG